MTCPKGKLVNGYRPEDLANCSSIHERVARFVLCMFNLTNSQRINHRFESNKWCRCFPKNRDDFVNCCSYVSLVLKLIAGKNYCATWLLSPNVFEPSRNLYHIRDISDFSKLRTGAVLFCINIEHIINSVSSVEQNAELYEIIFFIRTMAQNGRNSDVISEMKKYRVSPTHVMFYIDYIYLFGLSSRYIGGMNHPNVTDGVFTTQSLTFSNGFIKYPNSDSEYLLFGWNW